MQSNRLICIIIEAKPSWAQIRPSYYSAAIGLFFIGYSLPRLRQREVVFFSVRKAALRLWASIYSYIYMSRIRLLRFLIFALSLFPLAKPRLTHPHGVDSCNELPIIARWPIPHGLPSALTRDMCSARH
jgi:hypothetical protein